MTHKPKINKYLWLSAGKSWRFTTSTRHKLVVLFVFALCILPANLCGQSLAIKSNLLYDLTTSLNLGGEIRCDDTHTFSLSVNYNPWNFSGNKKMKHYRNLVSYYTNKNISVSYLRAKKKNDLDRIMGLYGNMNERYW